MVPKNDPFTELLSLMVTVRGTADSLKLSAPTIRFRILRKLC